MRAAQERGQECLPPKKRDLPAPSPTAGEPSRAAERAPGDGGEGSVEWLQGVAMSGRPAQAPSRYSDAGSGPEAMASLTVDQFGLVYKVAMPAASFSPVVNVSPLPPAFSMTSQLIQHPGIPYSPIHYTQLPPAPLQFVGSHYSVPYAVPPGFLPSHLLPSSAGLAASHIPHFVPYASLLADDSSPSPQAAHNFGKNIASVSPPGATQTHVGAQTLDVSQGRIPIYYPASYSTFETPLGALNPGQPLQENHLSPKTMAANGVQRPASGAKESKTEEEWLRTTIECRADGPLLGGAQSVRTETMVPSQRSTPDTDLEVQRVVGVLSSQDYSDGSAQQKDALSPLNLSHRNPPERKGKSPAEPASTTAEKNHLRCPSAASPAEGDEEEQEEQHCRRLILKGLAAPPADSSGWPEHSEPRSPAQERLPDLAGAPAQSHLPSHFMKGAIIQLATGELKRVEDLQTQDFVRSAEVSGGLKIDSSTVVDIQESPWRGLVTLHFVVGEQQSKVSIDVPPEHPFFVYGQGWSSCSPERTARLFSLPCHKLQVGDVCISISLQNLNGRLAPPTSPEGTPRERSGRGRQSLQDPQTPAGGKGQPEKGCVVLGSLQEPSQLEPISVQGWAGPSFQRFGEEPQPPLLRPSFIPQEVKLSIEGRSNAGK
ncbi:hypothetical protein JRQ81_006113 [Phrynocephalus forsythii]|uniref:AXH domain-containing protein n=1 Tax=Phrynocephalus forsythii TaxID=171643 RepID=A0A9Q1AU97_9SAUR|nr:hypothetical protein JRQ81_006113 [Phrynocephalus forsythii]